MLLAPWVRCLSRVIESSLCLGARTHLQYDYVPSLLLHLPLPLRTARVLKKASKNGLDFGCSVTNNMPVLIADACCLMLFALEILPVALLKKTLLRVPSLLV